jgi:uncharacterized protein
MSLLRPNFTAFLLVFFSINGSFSVAAEFIDLYSVKLTIDSEAKQERLIASQKALETVFVRATGDTDAVKKYPVLAKNIASADQLLASYSYYQATIPAADYTANLVLADDARITESKIPENTQSSQLMVEFAFKPQAVKQLLMSASAPFWQASRPEVLIWLVVQEGAERKIINSELSPRHFGQLQAAARRRGLPVALPLLDLEELSSINENDIWALSIDKIIASSDRYSYGAVLAGKISRMTSGQWYGQWTIIYQNSEQVEFFRGFDLSEFSDLGIDLIADKMANDYAVVTSEKRPNNEWLIQVDGVHSLQDFTRLSQSLRAVPALDTIRLHSVDQSSCYFYLDAVVQLQKIQALLALNDSLELQPAKDLIPSTDAESPTDAASLHYVWRYR